VIVVFGIVVSVFRCHLGIGLCVGPQIHSQVVAEMLNVAAGSIADCWIGRRKAETETNGSPYTFLFAFYHYY